MQLVIGLGPHPPAPFFCWLACWVSLPSGRQTPSRLGGAERHAPPCQLRRQGEDAAPARVMVFASSEAEAVALADPLRTVRTLRAESALSALSMRGRLR